MIGELNLNRASVGNSIHLYRHLLTLEVPDENPNNPSKFHVISIIATKQYTAQERFDLYPENSSGGAAPYIPPTILAINELAYYYRYSYSYAYLETKDVTFSSKYYAGDWKYAINIIIGGDYSFVWLGTNHYAFTVQEIEF